MAIALRCSSSLSVAVVVAVTVVYLVSAVVGFESKV
jgi:hypothetical protein